jgi:hypothetical protein
MQIELTYRIVVVAHTIITKNYKSLVPQQSGHSTFMAFNYFKGPTLIIWVHGFMLLKVEWFT